MNAQVDWVTQATEKAKRRRDRGVRRSAENAEDKNPGWTDAAIEHLRVYVAELGDKKFLTENFIEWLSRRGVAVPDDGRAFGGIMMRASREGIVVKAGYGLATSSNMSPKVLWRAA